MSQLIAAECFLGYGRQVWNPRINFFLLGRRVGYDIFDLWQTRLALKHLFSISLDLFVKLSHMWFIVDKFHQFDQIYELSKLKLVLSKFVTFYTDSWPRGLLSNYKHTTLFNNNNLKFPHFVFVSNSVENFAAINEAFSVRVPSFSLVDSNSSPTYSFISIPSNAKSLKSLFFFCIFVAKIVSYSNAVRAGKFLFSSFEKSKKLKVTLNPFNLARSQEKYRLIVSAFLQLSTSYSLNNFDSKGLLSVIRLHLFRFCNANFQIYLFEHFFKIFCIRLFG